MNIIFGTDGWRGILGKEINPETVSLVAQAFADYLNERGNKINLKIAIGYDGRQFSKEFAEIFAKTTLANNIETFLSDRVIPTPVLSYYVMTNKLNAGVMITASHNPPNYNGIKFKNYYGGPFFTEETLKVEKFIGKNKILTNAHSPQSYDLLSIYLNHIYQSFDFTAINKANLNILIDSMSGAGQLILQDILKNYDINVKTIYGTADINFSGRLAEPIENNLEPLKNELLSGNYSIGVATDGDADRLGVMLENGLWLSAQETIILLADYISNSKKQKGDIVKTSSVTDKLISYFQYDCRKVFDVQVGFKYICEKMVEGNISVGFEESGGFGFSDNIPERDGVYSALVFIEMLAKSNFKKISELVAEKRIIFGDIYYGRIDLHYYGADRMEKLPYIFSNNIELPDNFILMKKVPFYSSREIINGLKIVFEGKSRWLLVRASETEPMFRIYAEGENEKEVNTLLKFGKILLD